MQQSDTGKTTRQDEWRAFLLLTAVVAPAVTVAFVSGYGFLVWIYQMFAGPPGA